MITLRSAELPGDLPALHALDTGFSSDRIFRLEQHAHAWSLCEARVTPSLRKVYAPDELADFDWIQVAASGPEIVAYATLRIENWNRRAVLHHLYVTARVRGRGVGRRLVEAASAEAQRHGARVLWAETQTINYPAVRFYEANGFIWCGFDTSLYDPTSVLPEEVALFFARRLTP